MKSRVLLAEEGEKFWLAGDHLTFKVGRDEAGGNFAMATNWVAPGGGPPPHLHRGDDEMFYVFEGTMLFMEGARTFVGGPGTAVYLKRGVPHTFKNVGETPARFAVIAVPGLFETFVKECGDSIQAIPCDKAITPAVIEKLISIAAAHGIELLPDHKIEGEAPPRGKPREFWVMGEHVTIKLTAQETGGNFSLVEVESSPGGSVPPHLHRAMDEIFYILEGQYEFLLDGTPQTVNAGGTVYIPRGTVHGFRNLTAGKSRLMNMHTPAGFEKFFEECGVPCSGPERIARIPPQEELAALFDKHGMTLA
jgi:quercetin dioxygenase-like cupin family protein